MKNIVITVLSVIIMNSCNSKVKILNTIVNNSEKYEFSEKPKNIILMIGDGMGISQISAAMYQNNNYLNMENAKHIGLIKTHSASSIITDSAAGATAFSTGQKTYNGSINMDLEKKPLTPITVLLNNQNMKTGIITSSSVTHATPACFYGNQKNRYGVGEELAEQFLSSNIDVLIGGGEDFFNNRRDGRNLIDSLKKKNYIIIDSIVDKTPEKTEKLINFCAPKEPSEKEKGRGDFLSLATEKGISILDTNNENGFFLMIEGAQIDWGGHDNDSDYIISETLDFDKSVGLALEFAKKDKNTLVLITADHETGGYGIKGKNKISNKLKTGFLSDDHTATMVPLFAFGPGADNFIGIYDNTNVFDKIMNSLTSEK